MSEEISPKAAEGQQVPQQLQVDDSTLEPMYTNFCRVTGTPEEVILDFGLNTEPFGRSQTKIKLNQRMVCNFYTAKRLLMALSVAVQRHEKAFGILETDVNKRLKNPEAQG
ncbi:DUF3467 domain-containing protein [bacterium]|nr:DUF3467 domain-containing protein [bacterium]